MAPHSSTLAWKIPWTEETGRLQSMGCRRVRDDWATSLSLFTFMHWRRKWQPTPVFLPGESQGWGGHDWSDFAVAAAVRGFPSGALVKNPPASAGDVRDVGSVTGLGRSPEGNGNPLQYSCLENSMDRGAWRTIVPRVTMSQTQLSACAHVHTLTHTHTHTHTESE